jgi:hypothetical protein
VDAARGKAKRFDVIDPGVDLAVASTVPMEKVKALQRGTVPLVRCIVRRDDAAVGHDARPWPVLQDLV